jgi:hypothetical protein
LIGFRKFQRDHAARIQVTEFSVKVKDFDAVT